MAHFHKLELHKLALAKIKILKNLRFLKPPHLQKLWLHPIGSQLIKELLKKPYSNQLQELKDHNGVYQDKLIHQREAISKLKIRCHLVLMVTTQEINLIMIVKRWNLNCMNLRKSLLKFTFYRIGTTKTTAHIPGYNGYLPKTDLNPNAILHG